MVEALISHHGDASCRVTCARELGELLEMSSRTPCTGSAVYFTTCRKLVAMTYEHSHCGFGERANRSTPYLARKPARLVGVSWGRESSERERVQADVLIDTESRVMRACRGLKQMSG